MKFTILNHFITIRCAKRTEPYWWNLDHKGNHIVNALAIQRITHRDDGLKAWVCIVGPLRMSVGRLR